MDRLQFSRINFLYQQMGTLHLSSMLNHSHTDAATLREEILVVKFITSAQGALTNELRLRRPRTLNECV